jgi:predicted N-formylglutamate amidohydrolase
MIPAMEKDRQQEMNRPETALLGADEPAPVVVERASGASPIFMTCDHAGWRLPRRLGDLGLPEAERRRHIAWDIGAEGVARGVAEILDGTLVAQVYSRLAIDCNRPPGVADSIATLSETTRIPGNEGLSPAAVGARIEGIFRPYHERIGTLLDQRKAAGRPTHLIAMHSFTPRFKGVSRPWHIGVLYNRDLRLANILLALLKAEGDLTVGDNEPYSVDDQSDYTIPVHGEARGLPHVELEIRQDLIADAGGQAAWARRLSRVLAAAYDRFGKGEG